MGILNKEQSLIDLVNLKMHERLADQNGVRNEVETNRNNSSPDPAVVTLDQFLEFQQKIQNNLSEIFSALETK